MQEEVALGNITSAICCIFDLLISGLYVDGGATARLCGAAAVRGERWAILWKACQICAILGLLVVDLRT